VPGKEERAGAHWNGGSTARREESSGTAAFTDGEGAPVVLVECDEVLQLGWGKRVRKLQEIARIGGSGRSSPGNGGQWRRSAGIRAREGIPVVGGGGPGAGSGVESVALERGVGEEWVTEEWTAFRAQFENGRSMTQQRGKKRGRGGLAAGVPRGAGRHHGAWPRLVDDARVATRKQRGGY
jgi:hypothetical protein